MSSLGDVNSKTKVAVLAGKKKDKHRQYCQSSYCSPKQPKVTSKLYKREQQLTTFARSTTPCEKSRNRTIKSAMINQSPSTPNLVFATSLSWPKLNYRCRSPESTSSGRLVTCHPLDSIFTVSEHSNRPIDIERMIYYKIEGSEVWDEWLTDADWWPFGSGRESHTGNHVVKVG